MIGLNVRSPWSTLLINGQKTVETRSYALPQRLEGVELALIETPGKSAKFKSRIIGTITFSSCIQYSSKEQWESDESRHKVSIEDRTYGWKDKPKFGWIVKSVKRFENPIDPPAKRGIIYAKNCLMEKQK
jgi:predicted transcriptional regulator